MATTTVPFDKPVFMKDAVLTIEDNAFSAAVTSAVLQPSFQTYTHTGIDGTVKQFIGTPTWQLQATVAQDWTTTGSASDYLFNNIGEEKPFTLTPSSGGDVFSGTLTIVPPNIGGAAAGIASDQLTFPVSGQPERTPAA